MSRTIMVLIFAAGFGLLGVSKLDKAYAAATLSNGLEFIRLDLPDGTRWILGEGAIGRPYMARLVLANQGNRPIRLWDPNEGEGSSCARVVLVDGQGRKTELKPRGSARSAGIPSARTLKPSEVVVIELELLRLVDVISPPPPDDYTITAEYVASPSEDPEFKDLWSGTIRSQPLAMRIVAPPATRAAR